MAPIDEFIDGHGDMAAWTGDKAEVSGLGPALTLQGSDGTASVYRQHASLGLAWTFLRRTRVKSFLVVSGGVAHLSGQGATNDPARAIPRSGSTWSALGAVGIAAALRLSGRLWLAAEIDGIANLPPLVIRIAGTDKKQFSYPEFWPMLGYTSVSRGLLLLAAVAACSPRTLTLVDLYSDGAFRQPRSTATPPPPRTPPVPRPPMPPTRHFRCRQPRELVARAGGPVALRRRRWQHGGARFVGQRQ